MNEKVAQALDYVEEKYVAQAATRKKRKIRWIPTIAAVLALVYFWRVPSIPLFISAKAVSIASDSRVMERPKDRKSEEFTQWREQRDIRQSEANRAARYIAQFAGKVSEQILSGADLENRIWSPVNAYIALAMTAELTGGDTRQAVCDVLGVTNLDALRRHVSALWETVYQDNGREISVLANSLWLDNEVSYHQDVMDQLAYHYYASTYQGNLGSGRTNRAIATWLNNQTGGFLKDRTGKVSLDPESMLALVSTIYFQAQWHEEFDPAMNTQDTFHTVGQDVECTFMHKKLYEMNYYWAEDYGAVTMFLENGSQMWFILPDADKTVNDVLESGTYMNMITDGDFAEGNHEWLKVNLSVPQFDVSSSLDLKPALQDMGLTGIFEPLGNDFSPSIDSEVPVYLSAIKQDTRVAIDEEGVTAASYILLDFGAGAAQPPEEIIDFVLDRPFVFAITTENVPLFVGTVNNP